MRSERGAVLIHVAVGLLVLTALAGWAVDNGLLYVSRHQAQTAADGAALAGATAWAYDEADHLTPDSNGYVVQSINDISGQHRIGDQAAHATTHAFGTVPDTTGVCPPYLPSLVAGTHCVRVNVYQNGENGSSRLPVFFTALVGIADQGTRATATAIAGVANGTNCLKPWLIPDKFVDVDMDGMFTLGTDTYAAPGYTIADIGTVLTLSPGDSHDAAAPSTYYQLDANNYFDDIVGCELSRGIGQTVDTAPGASYGLTKNAVDELTANGPVIVPIGMFSPVEWASLDRTSGHFTMTIANMMGFRIEGMTGHALYGTIVAAPGEIIPGAATPGANMAFLKVIQLVQ